MADSASKVRGPPVLQSDLLSGWQQVAAINLKARQQQATDTGGVASGGKAVYSTLSAVPSVGHQTGAKKSGKNPSDIIVLSDDDSPTNHNHESTTNPINAHHTGSDAEGGGAKNVDALRELLQQEEQKLSRLKQKMYPGPNPGDTAAKVDEVEEGSVRKPNHGSKHNIVVAPSNQKTTTNSAPSSVISTRLQQLVDSIAADTALPSGSEHLGTGTVRAIQPAVKLPTVSHPIPLAKKTTQVPPVPGLTSLTTSQYQLQFHQATAATAKHTLNLLSQTLLQLTGGNPPPALRPKPPSQGHEVITITDSPSPITTNPPPLLSSLPPATASLARSYSSGHTAIQVPTISSTLLYSGKMSPELGVEAKEKVVLRAVENSRRYKDYLCKQQQVRKSFQKQIDKKIALAPYPKTFRQVWPVIPVHDSAFIRNFGLEAVFVRFDPNWKAAQERSAASSRVKPICNQCGCDFASAWQIRKSNSKQLLLCEACDFTNLKILQREKLSTQLRELVDLIKKEEVRFAGECEEARKQVVAIERQSILEKQMMLGYQPAQRPPPLLSSQLTKDQTLLSKRTPTSLTPGVFTNHVKPQVGSGYQSQSVPVGGQGKKGGREARMPTTYESSLQGIIPMGQGEQPRAVIPSILPMTSSHLQHGSKYVTGAAIPKAQIPPSGVPHAGSGSSSRKRKDPPEPVEEHSPPSKVLKPGSVLDQTLNKLTQQLLKRKLDEDREVRQTTEQKQVHEEVKGSEVRREKKHSPSPPAAAITPVDGETGSRKKRRKGTPRHKRLLSSSSDQ